MDVRREVWEDRLIAVHADHEEDSTEEDAQLEQVGSSLSSSLYLFVVYVVGLLGGVRQALQVLLEPHREESVRQHFVDIGHEGQGQGVQDEVAETL